MKNEYEIEADYIMGRTGVDVNVEDDPTPFDVGAARGARTMSDESLAIGIANTLKRIERANPDEGYLFATLKALRAERDRRVAKSAPTPDPIDDGPDSIDWNGWLNIEGKSV